MRNLNAVVAAGSLGILVLAGVTGCVSPSGQYAMRQCAACEHQFVCSLSASEVAGNNAVAWRSVVSPLGDAPFEGDLMASAGPGRQSQRLCSACLAAQGSAGELTAVGRGR